MTDRDHSSPGRARTDAESDRSPATRARPPLPALRRDPAPPDGERAAIAPASCLCCALGRTCDVHSHAAAAQVPAAVVAAIATEPGVALPGTQQLGHQIGGDVSGARAVTGASADRAARSLGTRAFTVGERIFFADGALRPDQRDGSALLRHELAHVAQQRGAPFPSLAALTTTEPGSRAERDAARAAGGRGSVHSEPVSIARYGPDDDVSLVLFPGRSAPRTFSYLPERGLDIVWPRGESTPRDIAAELLGDPELERSLEPVRDHERTGYRFRPSLLTPEWRTVYFEQRARAHALEQPPVPTDVLMLQAVPRYQAIVITEGVDVLGFGGATPTVLATSPMTSASVIELVPEVAPDFTSVYQPTLDYGASIGELEQIVRHPGEHRDSLSLPADREVVVTIDPHGPYARLISRQTTVDVPRASLDFGTGRAPFLLGLGGTHGTGLVPFTVPDSATPIVLPSVGSSPDGEGVRYPHVDEHRADELTALDTALSNLLPQRTTDTPLLIGAVDEPAILVVEPFGQPRSYRRGRVQVIGGPHSLPYAAQGRGVPTFRWRGGGDIAPTTSIEPSMAIGLPGRRRAAGAHGLGTDGSPMGTLGQSPWTGRGSLTTGIGILGGAGNPTVVIEPEPVRVHYQVLTVGELQGLVRRERTQQMLRGAVDAEGHRLDLDRARLIALTAGDRFVLGTRHDDSAVVEVVGVDLDIERVTGTAEGRYTPASAADQFDLARLAIRQASRRHPELAELFRALQERLDRYATRMQDEPRRANEYGTMLAGLLDVITEGSLRLTLMAPMFRQYRDSPRLRRELEEVEGLYGLAMTYGDQASAARTLFAAAERRIVLFPLLAMHVEADDMDAAMGDIFRATGDDSFFMGTSVEDARGRMRAISERRQAEDLEALRRNLEDARAATRSGDLEAVERYTALARAVDGRIMGRLQIMAQLHQALISFQHMGNSSARFLQVFTDKDERLESLMSRLEGHLRQFERAETPETRLEVLGRVQAMWSSEEEYRRFYEEVETFIRRSDFATRLAILVAAGLITMGAGSAAVGAGMVASEGLGLLALEAATFTVANRAGEWARAGSFIDNPNAGLPDQQQPEHGLGYEFLALGGDFVMNIAMFRLMRGIGNMWRGLGRTRPMLASGGQLLTSFVAFEAIGLAHHTVASRELPSLEQIGDITLQNATSLLLMHVAASTTRPLFDRIELRAATGTRRYQHAMEVLERRRADLQRRSAALLGAPQRPVLSETRLARLARQHAQLEADARALREQMAADPQWQQRLAAEPQLAETFAVGTQRLAASAAVMRDALTMARLGLRPASGSGVAPTYLFNPGLAEVVLELYRNRGFTVQAERLADGRTQITASRGNEELLLLEAREAVGNTFVREFGPGPTEAFGHEGTEVHSHVGGILDASEILDVYFAGNASAALTIIEANYQAQIAGIADRIANLRSELLTAPASRRASLQASIARQQAALARVQNSAPMQLLAQWRATPGQADAIARELLTAGPRISFDVAYVLRGSVARDALDALPAAERSATTRRAALRLVERLRREGVTYVETQGRLPEGIQEAEFVRACMDAGVEIRFLHNVSTGDLSVGNVGANEPGAVAAIADQIRPDRSRPANEAELDLAREIAALPNALRGSVLAAIRSPSAAGIDVAGPERYRWTASGMRRLAAIYRIFRLARQVTGRTFVLRPHVGEGYIERPAGAGAAAEAQSVGQHNIEMVLRTLEALQPTPADGVTVRLGHVAQASPEQIARMRRLGVIAEANISSNLVTGVLGGISEHPLLLLLYHDVPTMLSTDAGGIMGTTMQTELDLAAQLIEGFRSGTTRLRVGGRELRWNDLTAEQQSRFSIDHLQRVARQYRERVQPGPRPLFVPAVPQSDVDRDAPPARRPPLHQP